MAKDPRDTSTGEQVRRWLRDWVVPSSVALVTATGAWIRLETTIQANLQEVRHIRENLDRISTGGTSGLLDPAYHGTMDLHIRSFLEEEIGRSGLRRWIEEYSTTNHGGNPR